MNKPADLYERDFVLWAEEQARALRQAAHSGANLPLDWENLAEEIESLGRRDRRELENRISTILVHLLKLTVSSAEEPRRGWQSTVRAPRAAVYRLLRDSPSLKGQVEDIVREEWAEASAIASDQLAQYGDQSPQVELEGCEPALSVDQVLDDWWPETKA